MDASSMEVFKLRLDGCFGQSGLAKESLLMAERMD